MVLDQEGSYTRPVLGLVRCVCKDETEQTGRTSPIKMRICNLHFFASIWMAQSVVHNFRRMSMADLKRRADAVAKRYRPWPKGLRADSLPWFDSPLVQGASRLRYTGKAQVAATGPYWPKGARNKKGRPKTQRAWVHSVQRRLVWVGRERQTRRRGLCWTHVGLYSSMRLMVTDNIFFFASAFRPIALWSLTTI